jgi:dienelactone hydrolase
MQRLLSLCHVGAVLLCGLFAAATALAAPPSPPLQPTHGPGGSEYAHAQVIAHEVRSGAQGWWLFTPSAPVPATAPVVVFCHGWSAIDPKAYRAWIDHLVRRGNIVVYPNYQELRTPGPDFLPNAIAGIRAALTDLADGHAGIRADLDRVAAVGHSAGGVLAAQLAAVAQREGLPPLRASMPVEPGDGSREGRRRARIPVIDLQPMPPRTLLLVVVGGDDHWAGEQVGLDLYAHATRVPATNKNVVELESDAHGTPELIANHAAASASSDPGSSRLRNLRFGPYADFRHAGTVDALDWYGTWKLFDALTNTAFYGREREIALGGSPAQLSMGVWSDDVPVKPMRRLR